MKSMQLYLIKGSLFLLSFCLPYLAYSGQTYYISTQGSNSNNGSINSPWGSLEFAVTVAKAGDTIIMRGGTYFMNEVWVARKKGRGGAPGQYLTIKNFSGEKPFLKYNSRRLIIHADYVRVEGLHFEMPWSCEVFGAGNQIVNNTFTGPQPRFGAIETGGTDVLIEGNYIAYDDTLGNTRDHGIYVHKGERITVRNNIVIGSKGYGIHLFDEHKSADPAVWAANPFSMKDYLIEGNYVANSQERSGIIVAKGRGSAYIFLENITIQNNVLEGNKDFGVLLREGENVNVYNNTFYRNGAAPVFINTSASDVTIINNIFETLNENQNHIKNNSPDPNIVVSTNLYESTPRLVGVQDPSAMVGNAQFTDPQNADFSLQATSPAIDRGVNVGLAFAGMAPDLGAFEFGLITGTPGAPALSAPVDMATEISTTPTLVWNASGGATTYKLQVSTVSDFASTEFDQSGLTGTSVPVTGLSNSAVYFWRVSAANASGTSPWSAVWEFSTVGAGGPPSAPALSSPADNTTNISTTSVLTWNGSGVATTYQLQVSTVSDFASIEFDQSGLTGTSVPVTGLSNDTVYFWRVNAANAIGTSPWSAVWGFTTVAAALAAPILSSPGNNTINLPTDLDLVWNAVTGALSYQVQIANESDFSGDIIGQSGLIQTSFHLSDLPRERTLYWRVNVNNANGTSPWSTVWRFTTEAVTSVETGSEIPVDFRLGQNFPNPFNPTTNIAFDLPKSEFVSLKVYTLLGTEVTTLVSENLPAGKHSFKFNASTLPSGVFFYKLQTSSFVETKKMLLVR